MTIWDTDATVWTLGLMVLLVPVLIVAIRTSGATAQAKAKSGREQEYQRLTEQAVYSHELTRQKLEEVARQLADISVRVTSVERLLKEVE
ncbi:hypothetical protein [Krasilnikovia sp. MM14-A1259]|uniref:hypothetical protein n=1 Tax=Krasilnikovia sp. MM14-A1259 TaxID=3373539 RepID=UPI00382B032D